MASPSKAEKSGSLAPREDQINNAVNFLVHPKVRGSDERSKREFLEKKGLTAEEINEALARVQQSGGTPESHVVHAASQSQSSPWGKVLGGVGILAAGAYLIHRYAVPWVNEWRKKDDPTTTVQENTSSGKHPDQLILAKSLKSIEVLLVELNNGLHGLSDRIDRLTAGDQLETYRQDVSELKSLVRDSKWAQLNQSARESERLGMNGTLPMDASETHRGFISESGIESSSETQTYMRALGLSATQSEPQSQVEGIQSPDSLPEIQPHNGDKKLSSSDSEGAKQVDILASARAWQPPPLPQPIFPQPSKLES